MSKNDIAKTTAEIKAIPLSIRTTITKKPKKHTRNQQPITAQRLSEH